MTPSPVGLAGPSRPAIAEHVSITRVFGHSNNEQVRKLTNVKSPPLLDQLKRFILIQEIYFELKYLVKNETKWGKKWSKGGFVLSRRGRQTNLYRFRGQRQIATRPFSRQCSHRPLRGFLAGQLQIHLSTYISICTYISSEPKKECPKFWKNSVEKFRRVLSLIKSDSRCFN